MSTPEGRSSGIRNQSPEEVSEGRPVEIFISIGMRPGHLAITSKPYPPSNRWTHKSMLTQYSLRL